jgi:hypothetical protein
MAPARMSDADDDVDVSMDIDTTDMDVGVPVSGHGQADTGSAVADFVGLVHLDKAKAQQTFRRACNALVQQPQPASAWCTAWA